MENNMPHVYNLSHAECAESWETQSDANFAAGRFLRVLRFLRANMTCTLHILCAVVLIAFTACAPKSTHSPEKIQGENLMRHARNISVYEKDYGYRMEVLCPWDTTLSLGSFAIVKDADKAVDKDVAGVLKVPVQSVISFSATQWAVFLRLGEIDRVKGILEGRFVTDSTMRALLAQQKVYDIGTEAAADIERMIQLHPDALWPECDRCSAVPLCGLHGKHAFGSCRVDSYHRHFGGLRGHG